MCDINKSRQQLAKEVDRLHLELQALEIWKTRIEDAFRESEIKNNAFLKSIPDFIFVIKKDGTFLDVKSNRKDNQSIFSKNCIGKNLCNIGLPLIITAKLFHNIYKAIILKSMRSFEFSLIRGNSQYYYQTHLTAINPTDVMIIMRDITENKQTCLKLKQSHNSLKRLYDEIINSLVIAVEQKDPKTTNHQKRVALLASAIGMEIGLNGERLSGVYMSGLIHDLGKIYIPEEILNKPAKLTDQEYALVKTHCQIGYSLTNKIELPWPVSSTILQHHERINGSGYPGGLEHNEISIESKIIAVADVVEAMVSIRPYRPALKLDQALYEIENNSGQLYDPNIASACLSVFNNNKFSLD